MKTTRWWSLSAATSLLAATGRAFLVSPATRRGWVATTSIPTPLASSSTSPAVEEMSEERKREMFQFLLRDLQVEGVPLLGVDATYVHTMQAALWTTMAELATLEEGSKACVILEDLSVDTLRTFVDEFASLKSGKDGSLATTLPELQRFNLSLVGKGVGPAILIESANATADTLSSDIPSSVEEYRCNAAMKVFEDRMIKSTDPYPYKGDAVPASHRMCQFAGIFDVLSAFWNCICELHATDENQVPSTMLTVPGTNDETSFRRFAAIAAIIDTSLAMDTASDFVLAHFHPLYDRALIQPTDEFATGHTLPPSWLRALLLQSEMGVPVSVDEIVSISDFQRQSPVPAVLIKRASLIDQAADKDGATVQLTLPNGETKTVDHRFVQYAHTAIDLAKMGKEALAEAAAKERAIIQDDWQ